MNPDQETVRLTSIEVRNFRSLRDLTLTDLGPLNVFLGANGSGKTTIFQAMGFIRDVLQHGLEDTWLSYGGDNGLRSHGSSGPISIKLIYTVSENRFVDYRIDFDSFKNKPLIVSEECKYINIDTEDITSIIKFISGSGVICNFKDENIKFEHQEKELIDDSIMALSVFGQDKSYEFISNIRNLFINIRLFELSSSGLKLWSPARLQKSLNTDGGGLPGFIQYMKQSENKNFRNACEALRRQIPHFGDVDTALTINERLRLSLKDKAFRELTPAEFVSDGTLALIAMSMLLELDRLPLVVGFEEPERHLHPKLLYDFACQCRSATGRSQMFITTHSPQFLNALQPDEVRILWRDEDGYTKCERASNLVGVNEFMAEGAELGDLWMEGLLGAGDPNRNNGGPTRIIRE